MIVVGLTGGIGSGKSTVSNMFKDLGVPVYDSDSEAKRLMSGSIQLKKEIVGLLGEAAYLNGKLNRGFIAGKIFKNPETLERLNKIVHPAVRKDFLNWAEKQTFPYVIQETALIFENKAQDKYDYVISVMAPKELRLKRVIERDRVEKEEVLDRMENQMSDEEKSSLAHFYIENIDLKTTRNKVSELHQKIIGLVNRA